MRFLFLFFLVLVFCLSNSAQNLFNPSFQQLDAEKFGLKSMTRLCWNSKGELWGVHDDGIFKYDGYTLKKINPIHNFSNGILSDKIQNLFIDSKDNLWISYFDTLCLTRLNTRDETFTQINNLPNFLITAIKEDSHKNMWALTWGGGFYKFNPIDGTYKQYLPHTEFSKTYSELRNQIKDFVELPDGRFFLATFSNELAEFPPKYFNPTTEKFELFPIDEYVKNYPDSVSQRIKMALRISQFAYCDKINNLWIGTYSGLIHIDMAAKKAYRVTGRKSDSKQNLDNTKFYSADENGNLWVGTGNSGILFVDIKTREAHYILNDPKIPNTLADNRIRSITKDTDGNIWISTFIGVISIYNPLSQMFSIAPWNEMDLEFADRSAQRIPVNQVLVEKSGLIYISSEKGITIYDANKKEVTDKIIPAFKLLPSIDKETLPSRVQDIKQHTNEEMMVVSPNFPAKLNLKTKQFKQLKPDSLRAKYRLRMLFRHENDKEPFVYIEQKKGVLLFFTQERTSDEIKLFHKELNPLGHIYKETYSFRLKSGEWLISFGDREFCLFDPNKKETKFYNSSSKQFYFPDSTIRTAYVDKKQTIWFCTENGLYQFNAQTGKSIHANKLLGLENGEGVNALIELANGTWWIALDKQLVQWNSITKTLTRFDNKSGLRYTNFLGSIAQTDDKGHLYFATFNGELFFDPLQVKVPSRIPIIAVSKLQIKDSTLSIRALNQFLKSKRELSWNENFLNLELSSNQIYTPSPHHFIYRLLGLDTNWIDNGINNKIRYTNLSSGSYTLEASLINAYNIKSKTLQIPFIIRPPFWQTWWFYLLCALATAILLYSFIKYREKAYLKTQQVLEEKIVQRTQEIVNKAKEIELQKEIIQEKNNELTDSIHYAQRIQQSILPSEQEIKQGLPQHTILFKPKDIVSGDFYWYSQHKDSILWAVVDCTGHGVPGGFMSMLGSGLLNQIVNEELKLQPDEILNALRDRVILALKQTGNYGESKDGMDISLCRYIPSKNSLQFAGANNSVYVIRNNELIELDADKQPIGIHIGELKSFTLTEIELQKDDTIYMTSDGYIDQFGGPKGKKFKSVNFKKLITEIANQSIQEQEKMVTDTFLNWKGNYEQLDDVCVFGVKV